MDELRWILAGVGLVILALIYLWGIRARLREQLRERRRRAARLSDNQPVLEPEQPESATRVTELDFGHLGKVGPDHHLADKILVDVEITPVKRSEANSAAAETPKESAVSSAMSEAGTAATRTAEPEVAAEAVEKERRDSRVEHGPVDESPFTRHEQEPGPRETPQMRVLLTLRAIQGSRLEGSRIFMAAHELGYKLAETGVWDYFAEGHQEKPLFSVGHLREPGTFELATLETLVTPGLLFFMQLPTTLEAVAAVDTMASEAKKFAQRLDAIVCDDHGTKITPQLLLRMRDQASEFERRQQAHLSRR